MVTKVVAAICCNQTKPRTVSALIELAYSRIICGAVTSGIGLLPYVRNDAVLQAYSNEPDFTHLLFIDDDMADFTFEHVQAMLEADVPIVSGLITSRMPPFRLISSLEVKSKDEIMKAMEDQTLLEEDHVGMAFTLVTREVLDALRQPCNIWFTMDRQPRQSFLKETQTFIEKLAESNKREIDRYKEAIAWGRTAFLGSELIGEDVEFCRRARACGFKSYTHCGVIVGHIGTVPFNVRHNLLERTLHEETPNLKLASSNSDS